MITPTISVADRAISVLCPTAPLRWTVKEASAARAWATSELSFFEMAAAFGPTSPLASPALLSVWTAASACFPSEETPPVAAAKGSETFVTPSIFFASSTKALIVSLWDSIPSSEEKRTDSLTPEAWGRRSDRTSTPSIDSNPSIL